jgi:hypothetical protein
MSETLDIDTFKWRLAETIAWCAKHVSASDARDSLRSEHWRPPSFWYPESIYNPRIVVEALGVLRADELRSWPWPKSSYPLASADDLAGGRLLLYDPYQNLADGAAKLESKGFFNVDNEPAWDTWVSFIYDPVKWEKKNRIYLQGQYIWSDLPSKYFAECLVSWVPAELIELVTAGVNVNPELCIAWADDLDSAFTHQLRKSGLLD